MQDKHFYILGSKSFEHLNFDQVKAIALEIASDPYNEQNVDDVYFYTVTKYEEVGYSINQILDYL